MQPQRDLGQLHRHRVEVHAVDAALEHVALEQVHIGEPPPVDYDSLLVHLVEDRRPHTFQMRGHRVPRERVEEVQRLVGDVIHRVNQEVSRAHRGVEDLRVKQLADQRPPTVFHCRSRFVLLPLFAFCLGGPDRVAMPALGLAQLRPHRLELLAQHRADGLFNDVVHDVVGRVVGAARLAFAFVIFQIDVAFCHHAPLTLGALALLRRQFSKWH